MVTPRPARVMAAALAAVAMFTTASCGSVSHLFAHRASSSAAPTQVATDPLERTRQSDLEVDLGPGMTSRAAGGAMIVASSKTPIPRGVVAAGSSAATAVRSLDPQAAKNPLLIVVPRDAAQFERITGEKVASQLANTVTGGDRLPYVVLAPWTVENADSLTTKETLAHEAFHALTLEKLAAKRPLWLLEGWAEYVGQRTVPQAPHKRDDITPHVPSDEELRGENAADAYYVAFTFARYLRDTYGHDAVMAFYTEAVTTTASTESLARRHFGHGVTQLETGYADWYPTFR